MIYAVGDSLAEVDCILNCDSTSNLPLTSSENSYLELPMVVSEIFLTILVFPVCKHCHHFVLLCY